MTLHKGRARRAGGGIVMGVNSSSARLGLGFATDGALDATFNGALCVGFLPFFVPVLFLEVVHFP